MIISVSLTIFMLIIKFSNSFNNVFEPITYMKKKDLITPTVILIFQGVGLYIWIILLIIMFNKNAEHHIDSLLQSNNNHDISIFVYVSVIIIISITSALMYKTILNVVSIIRIIRTLQKQKRDDIENIFLRSLYKDSNEEIVQKYKNWISIPYPERHNLFIEDAMKLVAALLSQQEYEEAQKISEFYIRGNSKIVKTQSIKGITQVLSKEKR